MARKVFFSFHYERDVWRSSIVRNSDTVKAEADERGFIDAVEWEKLKKSGDAAVQKWIKDQMNGTSVTVGIRIHNIKDNDKKTDTEGKTTFGSLGKNVQGQDVYFGNVATVYDWVNNDGYRNFATWVESAAIAAGK
jgi:hypothetical protein